MVTDPTLQALHPILEETMLWCDLVPAGYVLLVVDNIEKIVRFIIYHKTCLLIGTIFQIKLGDLLIQPVRFLEQIFYNCSSM